MSDNEKEQKPKSLPVFPDITPSSMTWTEIHHIEESDISTEDDLRELLQLMYEFSEREFYLFTPKGQGVSPLIVGAERAGIVKFDVAEFHYYKRPDYERSYVRIQESTAEFDWQRELLKSPMYMQTKLSLTQKGRRQFELKEFRKEFEDATAVKKPTSHFSRFIAFVQAHAAQCFWAVVSAIISTLLAYWFLTSH